MDIAPQDQDFVNLLKDKYVVKAKYSNTIRVFIVSKSKKLDYDDFKYNVCNCYGLHKDLALNITFIDKEGDVVTIGNDAELSYALVHQSINPLKVMIADAGY